MAKCIFLRYVIDSELIYLRLGERNNYVSTHFLYFSLKLQYVN
jgi:hypothetical protein